MNKLSTTKPLLIMLYGYPGSGKTHLSRQLAETIGAAHVQSDRIRNELFEQPRYDKQENDIVYHLTEYMTSEFLRAGVSVVFDTNAMRLAERRELRALAARCKARPLLIWLQIDADSAFARLSERDRRKNDDKYAISYDANSFKNYIGHMQNPGPSEEYMVVSGKHHFNTQKSAILKRLYESGLVDTNALSGNGIVKPGLVNLIPNPTAGRVDMTRRNITIR